MSHLELSAQVVRLMVALRRLLLQDHGVDVDLSDDYALEALFDAARVAGDRKAESLAYAICEALEAQAAETAALRARLDPRYRRSLHERLAGAPGVRMYRGAPLPAAPPEAGPAPAEEPAPEDDEEGQYLVYRGRRLPRKG